jgi:hypothetical protein
MKEILYGDMIFMPMCILVDLLEIELEIVDELIYALSMRVLSLFKVTNFTARKC